MSKIIESSKTYDKFKMNGVAISALADENGRYILLAIKFNKQGKKHNIRTWELASKGALMLEFDSMAFDIEMNSFDIFNYVMLND